MWYVNKARKRNKTALFNTDLHQDLTCWMEDWEKADSVT